MAVQQAGARRCMCAQVFPWESGAVRWHELLSCVSLQRMHNLSDTALVQDASVLFAMGLGDLNNSQHRLLHRTDRVRNSALR